MSQQLQIPAILKKYSPHVRRAEQLEADINEPDGKTIAYFCRFYVLIEAMGVRKSTSGQISEDIDGFCRQLMALTEAAKSNVSTTSPDEGKRICENFAHSVFAIADEQDRSGNATMETAKIFYKAKSYFEILDQFGKVDAEITAKKKYCVFKALDINNAIKEGRVPKPGAPGEDLTPSVAISGDGGGTGEKSEDGRGRGEGGGIPFTNSLGFPEPLPPAKTEALSPTGFDVAPFNPQPSISPAQPTPSTMNPGLITCIFSVIHIHICLLQNCLRTCFSRCVYFAVFQHLYCVFSCHFSCDVLCIFKEL